MRHPAGAGLQHRPQGYLPRPGAAAAAWVSGLLFLAAGAFPRRCHRARGQARQPRMAAGQGAGALARLFSRCGAGAGAALLPVHRERPRRGGAGETAHGRGDHRPPDAAARASGGARGAGRAGAAGGRILAGGGHGCRAGGAFARADHPARSGQRHRRGRGRGGVAGGESGRGTDPAGCVAVRPEGSADPWRAARAGHAAGDGGCGIVGGDAGGAGAHAARGWKR